METLLYGSSALRAIRALRRMESEFSERLGASLGAPPLRELIRQVSEDSTNAFGIPTRCNPLRIVVPSPRMRSSSPRVRYHVCSRPLPRGSMLQADALGQGDVSILLPSAALVSIDFASVLVSPVIQGMMSYEEAVLRTVRLMLELCGSYAHDAANPRHGESACGIAPYSSLDEVSEQLELMPNLAGIGFVRKALQLASGASASPMESLAYALFCLPSNYGGFGFHGAELNASVVDGTSLSAAHKSMRGDLVWPQERVAVEY